MTCGGSRSSRPPTARESALRQVARADQIPRLRELADALRSEQRSGAGLLAGGLAYRLFLWFVPFGLVLAAIASFWVRSSPASLEDSAKTFGLGGVAARSAASAVQEGSRARWYLLLAGLALMVWAGASAVGAPRGGTGRVGARARTAAPPGVG